MIPWLIDGPVDLERFKTDEDLRTPRGASRFALPSIPQSRMEDHMPAVKHILDLRTVPYVRINRYGRTFGNTMVDWCHEDSMNSPILFLLRVVSQV